MSDTNRTQFAITKETIFGVVPTNPVFEILRTSGQPGLGEQKETITSGEIRADRNVTDLIQTNVSVSGGFEGELSFGSHDTQIEASLQGIWQNKPMRDNALGQIVTVAATEYLVTAGSNFIAGGLYIATGFADNANNQFFVARALTTNTAITANGLNAEAVPPPTAKIINVGISAGVTNISTTVSPNKIIAPSLNFTAAGYMLSTGQWIKIGGRDLLNKFATEANNGWARIKSVSTTELELDIVPTGWAADAGTGKTIYLFTGDYVRNGAAQNSFTAERQYLDHNPVTYEILTGLTLSTMSLSLQNQSVVAISYAYEGKKSTVSNSRAIGATDIQPPTFDVFNTTSSVAEFKRTGQPVIAPNFVMQLDFNVNNNLRSNTAIQNLGPIRIGSGQFEVEGTLNTYFGDKSLLEDILNNVETSLNFTLKTKELENLTTGITTAHAKAMVFDMPRIEFMSGSPNITGPNEDVMIDSAFKAVVRKDSNYTMQVQRFHFLQG